MSASRVVKTSFNRVHSLYRDAKDTGLAINLNWRYWGLAVSWGDSVGWQWGGNNIAVWFVGLHIGPLFFHYQWNKKV